MAVPTHQIAWSCLFTFLAFERCWMNCWTTFNSRSLPASKPRESWKTKPGLPSNIICFSMSCSPRCGVRIILPISIHGRRTTYLQGWIKGGRLDLRWMSVSDMSFDIQFTFLPSGSKIIGSSVVLQTFRRIVVLPALARPITRIQNCLNFARVFWTSSAVSWGFEEVDIAKDTVVAVSGSSMYAVWPSHPRYSCQFMTRFTSIPTSVSVSINIQCWIPLFVMNGTYSFFFIPFQPLLSILPELKTLFTYPFTKPEECKISCDG